jgi:hypothetical protein
MRVRERREGGVVGGEERKAYYDAVRVFDGMGWDGMALVMRMCGEGSG